MRLAVVLERARIDGTVRVALRQVRGLRERGHDVLVMCAEGAMLDEAAAAASRLLVEPALAEGPCAARDDRARSRVAAALADRDAVLAVAGAAFPLVVAAQPTAPVYLEILSNDLFVGDEPETVEELHRAVVEGRVLGHALEDALAHARRYGYAVDRVIFADLPVALPTRRTPVTRDNFVRPGEVLVLTAARLDDDHVGYIRPLIEAVGALREQGYPLRLVIVGDGRHGATLRRDAPPFATYMGFRDDLDQIYLAADLYVGEGSSRLEAALAGVPVVSSCAQTEPESETRAAFIYGMNQGTLHAYRPTTVVPSTPFDQAMALLLDDRSLRECVAERGYERVRTVHDVERYLSFLEKYLAGVRPAATIVTTPESIQYVRGDDVSALRDVAERARFDPRLGVIAKPDVSWPMFARVPSDCWDALADASRRTVLFGSQPPLSPLLQNGQAQP